MSTEVLARSTTLPRIDVALPLPYEDPAQAHGFAIDLSRARFRIDLAASNGSVMASELPLDDTWLHLAVALSNAQAWNANAGRLLYAVYFKRAFDIVVAATLLCILSPVLILTALAIRLESSGSVLFRQERIGLAGQAFTMCKFRSMRPDRRKRHDPNLIPPTGDRRRTHKAPRDPRVTKVGRFIRRTSLDELPQLWNVLKGDMSLIGPRPELPNLVHGYREWQHLRHVVRPGITGWWQVNGRSDRPLHENTNEDLYYVEHLSLALDIKIALRTPKAVLSGAGAF